MDTSRTIAIVGAGFSGTAVALNLLRLPQAQPMRVVLIERNPPASSGRQRSAHAIAASQLSALMS